MPRRHTQAHENAIKNRIHYWERVKHMMEMHENKEKSIHFRKKMLQDQSMANYQNEYEQIRGALAHSMLSHESKTTLERRETELRELGAKIA